MINTIAFPSNGVYCRYQVPSEARDTFVNFGSAQMGIGMSIKGLAGSHKVLLGNTRAGRAPRPKKKFCAVDLRPPYNISAQSQEVLANLKAQKKTITAMVSEESTCVFGKD